MTVKKGKPSSKDYPKKGGKAPTKKSKPKAKVGRKR